MRLGNMRFYLVSISLIFIGSIIVNTMFASSLDANPLYVPKLNDTDSISVILMIGDGMGYEHVELANLVEYGYSDNLTLEKLPHHISVRTNDYNNLITDSAAAATAISTGYKTRDGYLGMNTEGEELTTIVDIAQTMDKSTGIVATCSINHATPAAFMVHSTSRYDYDTINAQINESGVDIILGGGNSYFNEEQFPDYEFVSSRSELLSATSSKVLGLFADSHLDEERDRNLLSTPSLAEMTEKAIELLSVNENGFFLMVEGSQIDWGGHDNDKVYVALETIAFDYAVKVAYDYVQSHDDVILLVTSDHETGGLKLVSENLENPLPTSLDSESERRIKRISRSNQIEVTWSSADHTSEYVPLFGYGEKLNDLENDILIENTDIFTIMNQSFHNLSVEVTDISPPPTEESIFPLFYAIIPILLAPLIKRKKKR